MPRVKEALRAAWPPPKSPCPRH